ncbi:MAG: hypothetical protein KGL95_09765 [Patescibacteria group bacterium]|nr:hypothetical protein [Patescibacteria group bacterium]
MHKKKRSVTLLLIGILGFLLLLFFTHTFSPTVLFSVVFLTVPSIIPFFLLVFVTLFGLAGFTLNSNLQGILAGLFGILFLLLRMFSFTHWFFTLLLVTLFAVVEMFFLQKS